MIRATERNLNLIENDTTGINGWVFVPQPAAVLQLFAWSGSGWRITCVRCRMRSVSMSPSLRCVPGNGSVSAQTFHSDRPLSVQPPASEPTADIRTRETRLTLRGRGSRDKNAHKERSSTVLRFASFLVPLRRWPTAVKGRDERPCGRP